MRVTAIFRCDECRSGYRLHDAASHLAAAPGDSVTVAEGCANCRAVGATLVELSIEVGADREQRRTELMAWEGGFTYDQNPADALRIMLRMAGFKDDEIDEETLEEARRRYEAFPVESMEWPDVIGE